ncbi:hypothetical protein Vi05172_g9815 [Venturia inaequalis]|nr:hypothetical protein Vi05172_g9815 [Venturia inaequalis]
MCYRFHFIMEDCVKLNEHDQTRSDPDWYMPDDHPIQNRPCPEVQESNGRMTISQCLEAKHGYLGDRLVRIQCTICNYTLELETGETLVFRAGQQLGEDPPVGLGSTGINLDRSYLNRPYQEHTPVATRRMPNVHLTNGQYDFAAVQEIIRIQQWHEQSMQEQQASMGNGDSNNVNGLQSSDAVPNANGNPMVGRNDEEHSPGDIESPLATAPQDPVNDHHDYDLVATVRSADPFDEVMERARSGEFDPHVVWNNPAGAIGGGSDPAGPASMEGVEEAGPPMENPPRDGEDHSGPQ